MKPQNSIKIIAGRLKNRSVLLPLTPTTRPTKSIARESLFDTLQSEIANYAFVEVFAGSGSVGIEAYSRGCQSVCFIEKSRDAYKTLQQNLKTLEIEGAYSLQGDSFSELSNITKYLAHIDQKAWFYMDPPFDIRENFADIYEKLTNLIASIDPKTARGVVIEHSSDAQIDEIIGKFELFKKRKFGKTTLSYYLINTHTSGEA